MASRLEQLPPSRAECAPPRVIPKILDEEVIHVGVLYSQLFSGCGSDVVRSIGIKEALDGLGPILFVVGHAVVATSP